MRTTVTIEDSVYAQAKVVAAQGYESVGELITTALRQYLSDVGAPLDLELPVLPQWSGGGIRPGIDINDSSSLLEVLDQGQSLNALR